MRQRPTGGRRSQLPLLCCAMRFLAFAIAATLLLPPSSSILAAEDNWPQWRGPSGRGVSGAPDYPAQWGPQTNVAWKTPVPGRGHSSPVVWGDRIFLTTSIEGAHVPDHHAPDHLGYDLKPGYLHPEREGRGHRHDVPCI